jgi:small subunit ribosomal protein S1
VLSVGQEITAKILKFDQEKNRVSLGVKQLGEDPWVGISRRYPQGTRLFGKVTNLTDYGAFVESKPASKAWCTCPKWTGPTRTSRPRLSSWATKSKSWSWRSTKTASYLPGHEAVQGQPVGRFRRNHKKGDKVTGQIKSITDFGVFIGLPGGIDGLVHLSDLSWQETGEEAVRKYKKGDEVEAVVLGIDVEKERISLGIKQLEGDPFNNFISANDKGSLVNGTVKTVDAKGAVMQLADDVEGYLRASEISADRVEDARNVLKEGEQSSPGGQRRPQVAQHQPVDQGQGPQSSKKRCRSSG